MGGNSSRWIRNTGLLVWTMGGIVSSKKSINMIGLWFQKPVLYTGAVKHLQVGCQNTGPRMGLLALSVRLCLQVKPTWCGVVQPPPGPVGTQECGIPPPRTFLSGGHRLSPMRETSLHIANQVVPFIQG